jgi:hypothetical protein
MANWNELWDADNPSDSTNANEIDDYENNLRGMIEERLQDLIYGFTSGEDTDAPGFKLLRMRQASDPTTPADMVDLYCKDVGGNNEIHFDDEAGNGPAQLTAAGNIGGTNIELLAGKDLIGSATSDITLNTNKFTVAGATGNTVIAGTLTQQGVATLADTSALATSGAPAADAQIANKKYVDDHAGDTSGEYYVYRDLDGTPTKIYTKYLTGTLDADASTSVAHGVTGIDNILSVTVACYNSSASEYCVNYPHGAAGSVAAWHASWDGTNVIIDTAGANVQSQKYRIRVDYKI